MPGRLGVVCYLFTYISSYSQISLLLHSKLEQVPIQNLASHLDVRFWPLHPLQDPKNPGYPQMAAPDHPGHLVQVTGTNKITPLPCYPELTFQFSLPALPLWLSTWFIKDFYITNEYWHPNMWSVPGVGMMEFVILFFPIFEIYEYKLRHKRLSAISRQHPHHKSMFPTKYTQRALELTLESPGVDSLEEFAATKDFTGENIIFLRKVSAWKKKWVAFAQNSVGGVIRAPAIHVLYNTAEQIFFQSISRVHSSLPLNLEDDIYTPLAGMFCRGTSAPLRHIYPPPSHQNSHNLLNSLTQYHTNQSIPKAQIAPFAGDTSTLIPRPLPEASTNPSINNQDRPQLKRRKSDLLLPPPSTQDVLPPRRGSESAAHGGKAIPSIPPGFTVEVFDRAEGAVMGMVLMGTWMR